MDPIEQYKQNVAEIEYLLNDATQLQRYDLEVLQQALKVISTQVQIQVFDKVMEKITKESGLDDMLSEIDSKIRECKEEKVNLDKALEQRTLSFGSKSTDKRKAKLDEIISCLESMKKEISSRNYLNLPSAFSSLIRDRQDLIDRCSISLAVGYMDFETYFGKRLVSQPKDAFSLEKGYIINEDTVNKVFGIISNKELYSEIKKYFDFSEKLEAKTEEEKRLATKYKPDIDSYIALFNPSLDDIKRFLELGLTVRDKNGANGFTPEKFRVENYDTQHLGPVAWKRALDSYREEYAKKNRNSLTRTLYFSQLKELDDCIKSSEKALKDYEQKEIQALTEYNEVADKLEKTNPALLDIAIRTLKDNPNSFSVTLPTNRVEKQSDENEKPKDEQYKAAASYFLGSIMYKYEYGEFQGINQKSESVMTEKKNENIASKQKKAIVSAEVKQMSADLNTLFQQMSPEAQDLILHQYSTSYQITHMREERYCRTPVICLFILKAIGESKGLSWEDLQKITGEKYSNDLTDSYEKVIATYLQNKRQTMTALFPPAQEMTEGESISR